jgi:hypothetical protein
MEKKTKDVMKLLEIKGFRVGLNPKSNQNTWTCGVERLAHFEFGLKFQVAHHLTRNKSAETPFVLSPNSLPNSFVSSPKFHYFW